MARGGKGAAALRTLVASLKASEPSHKLPPALTALHFTVPRTFNTPSLWQLMRRELPRIAYANPNLRIGVDAIEKKGEGEGEGEGEGAGQLAETPNARLDVHFSNMPARTIVIGDKSRACVC